MELWAIIPELTLAGGFLLLLLAGPFLDGRAWIVYAAGLLILVASALLTLRMLPWLVQHVFHGTYVLDPLAHFIKLYSIAASVVVLLACFDYFRGSKFYSDIPALVLASTLGAAMLGGSVDLALVILFFYILTASTLILVGLVKEDDRANEAALKYFLFGAAATGVMLYGLSLLYGLTGSTHIPMGLPPWGRFLAVLALALALVGFGFKMAIAPFHMWAPDVYHGAPTPIAGFLAVLPKTAAVAIVLRLLVGSFGSIEDIWKPMLALVAALTMTVGNIFALRQTNLKRLLAYSSIAQLGYIAVGLAAAGQPQGGQAALFYLLTYLPMNLGAFLLVARMEQPLGSNELGAYSGLFRRAPSFTVGLTLLLFSLAGIPPLAGYVGKVLLISASLNSGLGWLAVVMALNFVLAVYYYLRVVGNMYFGDQERVISLPPSRWMDLATGASAAATVVIGLFPQSFIRWVEHAWLA